MRILSRTSLSGNASRSLKELEDRCDAILTYVSVRLRHGPFGYLGQSRFSSTKLFACESAWATPEDALRYLLDLWDDYPQKDEIILEQLLEMAHVV